MPLAFPRRRAARFAKLIDQPGSPCRPDQDDDLEPLVDTVDQLRFSHITPSIDPEFRADLRAKLVDAAKSRTPPVVDAPTPDPPAPASASAWPPGAPPPDPHLSQGAASGGSSAPVGVVET